MSKQELRREYLSRRSELTPEAAEHLSAIICGKIDSAPWFQSAAQLIMYMPIRQEVNIRPLMETAWEQGKTVYLPKSDPATKTMRVYAVQGLDELRPGAYGILEPQADEKNEADIEKLDAVFIPGVVFDRHGYRIGYGGGYYDRFLPRLKPSTLLIGLAYSWQVVERIPREAYDRPLHMLVTEHETMTFSPSMFTKHSRSTQGE